MAIKNNKVEEQVTDKQIIFAIIEETIKQHTGMILNIKKMERNSGIYTDLPNIGITLNNKIVEVSKEFQRAGISMNTKTADAVMSDMADQVIEATNFLGTYITQKKAIDEQKQKSMQVIDAEGPIQKFFLAIKGLVIPRKPKDLSYTQEERDRLNDPLLNYEKAQKQLQSYQLEDDMVPALVKYICQQIKDLNVTDYRALVEGIALDLQKLGISNLIPRLTEELDKKNKETKIMVEEETWQLSDEQKERMQKVIEQKIKDKESQIEKSISQDRER